MKLKDQVAVVTGAGRGIGKGIAEVFAKEGATVIIASKGEKAGRETEKKIVDSGGKALYVQTDVSKENSIVDMVEHVIDEYGQIDTLVNNAGVTLFKPLQEATIDDWEYVINVDLRGVFLCSKYVSKYMIEKKKGSIINISSNHAFSTLPNTEIYAAAKAGVNGMSKSMSLSLGEHGIRVNSLCPGFTNTPHYHEWLRSYDDPEEAEKEVISLHATGRIATPYDIANLAVYLASDEAEMVTGSEFLIDGGLSTRLYNSKYC